MADHQDLAGYVQEHPDDHEQRWRLAKKLYMACEYRDALHHLAVLQRDWEPTLNVARYLAATHYRLGRYDEAISELREAAAMWPDEIPVREQLARALEVAGRQEEAIDAWEQILRIDPRHPMAARTIERLDKGPTGQAAEELHLSDSDSGIDLTKGIICPNCGARNNEEFERCWQCHAPLSKPGTPTPEISKHSKKRTPARWFWTMLMGSAIVGMLCGGVFITLRQLSLPIREVGGFAVANTADELLAYEWLTARLATGAVLILFWPMCLWFSAVFFCDNRVNARTIGGVGFLLGILTYLLLWVPVEMLAFTPLVPVALSLVLIFTCFPVKPLRAVAVWTMQIALMALLGAGMFVSQTGVRPLMEIDKLGAYAARTRGHDKANGSGATLERVPGSCRVSWEGSGSAWLDSMGRMALFEVTCDDPNAALTLELAEGGSTARYYDMRRLPFEFTHEIAPRRNYLLLIGGKAAAPVKVRVKSLLTPKLEIE